MEYILSIRGQIACMCIILYIVSTYYSSKRINSLSHKLFSALLVLSVVNLIFDMVTVYTVNHVDTVPLPVNRICHVIFVGSMAAVLYVVFMYVYTIAYKGKEFKKYWLIPLIIAVAAVALLPFGYEESPYGNYSSGQFLTVAFISAYTYFFLIVFILIKKRKSLEKKMVQAVLVAIISLLTVTVIQGIFKSLLITHIGLTIINVALFYTLESPDAMLIELLAHERKNAENANRAKSLFLAQMSHEIRTPINAVLGMNEMILRETDNEDIREYALNIGESGRTLLALINSILDFSKIEDGKMELLNDVYDTASMINNLIQSISDRARSKGLMFYTQIDEDLPSAMIGDEVRLTQIIMNLLTNAVKYTKKGSVTFSIKKDHVEDNDVYLNVSVADTGIGIKKEDMGRLFETFARLEEKKNHNIEGTGLGMTIVSKLLIMMDSGLDIRSEYGKGSVFSFVIRQKIDDPSPIGDYKKRFEESKKSEHKEVAFNAPDARVLIVDDNSMNLKVAKNLLKLYAIVPDLADSGAKALDMVKEKHYDVICMDHMMPVMDGIETYQKMKEENLIAEDTVTLMMTANAVVGAREQYLEAGFRDFISKPIDIRTLEEKMLEYLPKSVIRQGPAKSRVQNLAIEKKNVKPAPADKTGEKEKAADNASEDILEFEPVKAKEGSGPDDAVEFEPMEFDASGFEDENTENMQSGKNSGQSFGDLEKKLAASGLDTKAALAYCGGSMDFYKEMLTDYTTEFESKSAQLNEYLNEGKWKDYQIVIHALKSTSKTIGAMQVSGQAKELEDLAKQEKGEDIRKDHSGFMKEYEGLVESIKKMLM
ncbi:MAG: response regulator [Lachnospiraceae bacterium]|nr:response regulator [Lachnospiraceae bacterium]